MNTPVKTWVGILTIFIVTAIAGVFIWLSYVSIPTHNADYSKTILPNKTSPKRYCTMETKSCPDGSFVSRQAPSCQFAPCPGEDKSQMANPASVNCEQNGGTLDIRTGADGGQTGYCKFSDGSECEEWQYFRGECKSGDNKDATIDISNWQTYRNEKYGFEFKYPKYLKLNFGIDRDKAIEGTGILHNFSFEWLTTQPYAYNFSGEVIDKMVGGDRADSELKFINQSDRRNLFVPNELNIENGKVYQKDGYGTLNYYFIDSYYLVNDKLYYHFQSSGGKYDQKTVQLFQVILSTFKFIN
jgi:putative hemolysin